MGLPYLLEVYKNICHIIHTYAALKARLKSHIYLTNPAVFPRSFEAVTLTYLEHSTEL
jgi:hypothetical protein